MYRFDLITRINAEVEAVFLLASSIDAHVGSMSESGEQAIGGVTNGQIGFGEVVTWRARHFGIWFTMTSKITSWDPPRTFTDQAISGPFRIFHHVHRFEVDDDATVMTDSITFAAPFGIIGRMVERIVLGPYLRRLIAKRNAFLRVEAGRG